MKRNYIGLAAAATIVLLFSACEREKEINGYVPGENEMAFRIGSISTRSDMADDVVAEESTVIPVGTDGKGNKLYLKEVVEDLNAPVTRGTPAYTENVGDIYGSFAANISGTDYSFKYDKSYATEAGSGYWIHAFGLDPWKEYGDPLKLYMRMPETMSEVTNLKYGSDAGGDGKISFSYGSQTTASGQQDILFTYDSVGSEEYKTGRSITFYHALTGVKFRTGNDNSGATKTIITGVKFTGLYATGDCVFDSSVDGKSAADGKFTWSNRGSNGVTFSQEFKNTAWTEEGDADGTVNYESGDGTNFGSSWYSAANDKNLNDENGSLTFWFIPQQMSSDVKLDVTFRVKTKDTPDGTEITLSINLGDLTKKGDTYPTWNAGQLRTYTLVPQDVDVEIFDTMSGLTKSNLHVTNTGNVDEYVRMMLVGNWYDGDGNILMGYKYPSTATTFDEGDDINTMASPWFRGDAKWNQYFDDTFKNGLPNTGNPWVFGTGSYFYYPDPIGPGVTMDSGTEALFQSYVLPESAIPTIWLPSSDSDQRVAATGVHLVMEVVIQAISTIDPDTGEAYAATSDKAAWQVAWSKVTGKEIKAKTNENLTSE